MNSLTSKIRRRKLYCVRYHHCLYSRRLKMSYACRSLQTRMVNNDYLMISQDRACVGPSFLYALNRLIQIYLIYTMNIDIIYYIVVDQHHHATLR